MRREDYSASVEDLPRVLGEFAGLIREAWSCEDIKPDSEHYISHNAGVHDDAAAEDYTPRLECCDFIDLEDAQRTTVHLVVELADEGKIVLPFAHFAAEFQRARHKERGGR